MLLSKRCPYTNVVNFYDDAEPYIAIGSITRCGTSASSNGYAWRFYAEGETKSGRACDASSAERALRAVVVPSAGFAARISH